MRNQRGKLQELGIRVISITEDEAEVNLAGKFALKGTMSHLQAPKMNRLNYNGI